MRKLLAANFSRLRKDKLFFVALLFVLLACLFEVWMSCNAARLTPESVFYEEDVLFKLLPMIGFVLAFFLSLHMGAELDEHTLRNKLIVGHTRCEIFFAQYLASMAAALILLCALLLPAGVAGVLLFKSSQLEWMQLIYLIFCCILLTAVFSAICTSVSMNAQSRASAMAICLLLLLGLLFLASYCGNALSEPETTYTYVSISADGIEYGDIVPNAAYVSGLQRVIYEWIYDALPTGQSIQIHNLTLEHAGRWPLLSIVLLGVSTILGFLPFRRRDLK